MGEAKRRGSLAFRTQQAQEKAKAEADERARQRVEKFIQEKEAFDQLPPEEKNRIQAEQVAALEKKRKLQQLLAASLGMAISGKGCL